MIIIFGVYQRLKANDATDRRVRSTNQDLCYIESLTAIKLFSLHNGRVFVS